MKAAEKMFWTIATLLQGLSLWKNKCRYSAWLRFLSTYWVSTHCFEAVFRLWWTCIITTFPSSSPNLSSLNNNYENFNALYVSFRVACTVGIEGWYILQVFLCGGLAWNLSDIVQHFVQCLENSFPVNRTKDISVSGENTKHGTQSCRSNILSWVEGDISKFKEKGIPNFWFNFYMGRMSGARTKIWEKYLQRIIPVEVLNFLLLPKNR